MKNKQEFYVLCSPLWATAKHAVNIIYGTVDWFERFKMVDWTEEMDCEQITCPLVPKHMRGGKRISALHVTFPSSRIGDFMWTGLSEPLITADVRDLFVNARFTGFKLSGVVVEKVKYLRKGTSFRIPVFLELIVTGKGGNAHPDSGIHLLYECDSCGLKEYSSFRNGFIVDKSQWDGSDFFTVNGYPAFILITERVKNIIIQNKITNCAIIPSQDFRWGEGFRPEDHPEHYMPE